MEPVDSELEDNDDDAPLEYSCSRCQATFRDKKTLAKHLSVDLPELCFIETITLAEMMNSSGLFVPAYNCTRCIEEQNAQIDVDKIITNDLAGLRQHVENAHHGSVLSLRFPSAEMRSVVAKAITTPQFARLVREVMKQNLGSISEQRLSQTASTFAGVGTSNEKIAYETLIPDLLAPLYGCNCPGCSFKTHEPHILEDHVIKFHSQNC